MLCNCLKCNDAIAQVSKGSKGHIPATAWRHYSTSIINSPSCRDEAGSFNLESLWNRSNKVSSNRRILAQHYTRDQKLAILEITSLLRNLQSQWHVDRCKRKTRCHRRASFECAIQSTSSCAGSRGTGPVCLAKASSSRFSWGSLLVFIHNYIAPRCFPTSKSDPYFSARRCRWNCWRRHVSRAIVRTPWVALPLAQVV